jgi:AcrR family transcriptional regulator
MGLRELKKEQTRQHIAETAWRLFADRGFDAVTVAEIAREALVAPATVFNYFPTKEDIFFFRLESYGAELVESIRNRRAGESALSAFRRYLLESGGLLAQLEAGDRQALCRLRKVNRVIAESASLRAREQRALAASADALAALLVAETKHTGDDLRPRAAANALIGVQRALIDYVRARVLSEAGVDHLARDVRRLARQSFALLADGLDDYAPKRTAT